MDTEHDTNLLMNNLSDRCTQIPRIQQLPIIAPLFLDITSAASRHGAREIYRN